MSNVVKWSRGFAAFVYSGIAVAVAFVVLSNMNFVVGPATETTGTVQGSAFVPADGPPSKSVSIRLPDGAVVLVNTQTHVTVTPGQEVRLHVYRRLVTNTRVYVLASAETTK